MSKPVSPAQGARPWGGSRGSGEPLASGLGAALGGLSLCASVRTAPLGPPAGVPAAFLAVSCGLVMPEGSPAVNGSPNSRVSCGLLLWSALTQVPASDNTGRVRPRAPQPHPETLAVDLNSSQSYLTGGRCSEATTILLWEAAPQGQRGGGADPGKAPWASVLQWGITGGISLDLPEAQG